jgi:hypothetical protein
MHLNIADVVRVETRLSKKLREDVLLRACMRSRDGYCLGRVIGVSPEDNAEDGILVSLGVLEPLQDHCANAVGTTIPIRAVVKGIAVSCPSLDRSSML